MMTREKAWTLLQEASKMKTPDHVYPGIAGLIIAFELKHLNDNIDYLVDYQKKRDPTFNEEVK